MTNPYEFDILGKPVGAFFYLLVGAFSAINLYADVTTGYILGGWIIARLVIWSYLSFVFLHRGMDELMGQ